MTRARRALERARKIADNMRGRMKEEGVGHLWTKEYRTYLVGTVQALILARENCAYCGERVAPREATLDHGLPICRGGNWTKDNLTYCHRACNERKGIMSNDEYEDFLKFLEETMPPDVQQDILRRLRVGTKVPMFRKG